MIRKNIELMAPAGGVEQFYAAIAAGAGAIYIGLDKFSARSSAANFSLESLDEYILYAHSNDVKVYVAINTLFKDEEILLALEYAFRAHNLGVDAIIVQDFGLLYLLNTYYPEIEIHASTQMGIHNKSGALFAKKHGLSRIVLARELSLKEIKDISELGIETEIFVHGAICISYSGQCFFSQTKGGRSANRGACAQPCRMKYKLYEDENLIDESYLISPVDRSLLGDISKLEHAGVRALKIEGRMRNYQYVFESVRQYKNAIEAKNYDLNGIARIFSRGRFGSDYLYSTPSHELINKSISSNAGLFLGNVDKSMNIEAKVDIELGDGISVYKSGIKKGGFIITKILKDGKPIKKASVKDNIKIFPTKYRVGDDLFNTSSTNQKTAIDRDIKAFKSQRKLVNVCVDFMPFERIRIKEAANQIDLNYEELNPIETFGETVQNSINMPLNKDRILKAIEKKSDEFVALKVVAINLKDGFLPISQINDVRRIFIKNYKEKRIQKLRKLKAINFELKDTYDFDKLKLKFQSIPNKLLILNRKEHLNLDVEIILASGVAVCINPFYKDKGYLNFSDLDFFIKNSLPFYLKTPTIIREEFDEMIKFIKSLYSFENFKGIVSSNYGLVTCLRQFESESQGVRKIHFISFSDINIFNSYASGSLNIYNALMPSEELSKKELMNLKNKDIYIPLIYGKIKMMDIEYCPNQKGNPCAEKCRKSEYKFTDEIGSIRILHDKYCRVKLMSHSAKNHLSAISDYRKMGFSNFAIELYDESLEDSQKIVDAFKFEHSYGKNEYKHFYKGVK